MCPALPPTSAPSPPHTCHLPHLHTTSAPTLTSLSHTRPFPQARRCSCCGPRRWSACRWWGWRWARSGSGEACACARLRRRLGAVPSLAWAPGPSRAAGCPSARLCSTSCSWHGSLRCLGCPHSPHRNPALPHLPLRVEMGREARGSCRCHRCVALTPTLPVVSQRGRAGRDAVHAAGAGGGAGGRRPAQLLHAAGAAPYRSVLLLPCRRGHI
jgi:hypothetical protein